MLSLFEAVKDNNFHPYVHTLIMMPDLFFNYGGQNYARYLTYFSVLLASLEISYPDAIDLLKFGAFSVGRSFIPGYRTDVDKWMEETFIRHANSLGSSGSGVTGLLTNSNVSYQRWVPSTHSWSQYVNVTVYMVGLTRNSANGKHRDVRSTEVNERAREE